MKEFKLEELMPLEALKSKIWSIFDILRNESMSSSDFQVILFLLSAYKDGLISSDIYAESNNIKDRLSYDLHFSNRKLSEQYLSIFKVFEPKLMNISDRGLMSIIDTFGGLNNKVLSKYYPEVFDSILYRITNSQGRYGGEYIQPIELTRLICSLADLKPKSKVFNPFAGLASFDIALDSSQNYFGQENNLNTWAVGALRLMAYNKLGTSRYVCDDSISHWPNSNEKFDLIVSNPPFGMRLGNQYNDFAPNIRTIEHFLLEKGVDSLTEEGKLISILPQGFLFRGGHEQNFREHLVNEDLIDTIISLPGGLLSYTAIPLVILVLNKVKKYSNVIRLVDAKQFVETKSLREKELNDYVLSSILNNNNQSTDAIRLVSNEQIRANDFNLSVQRYFQKEIEGLKLGEILELVKGKREPLLASGKLVRIKDLKDDNVDFILNVDKIESTGQTKSITFEIKESCLLLAVKWKALRPTLFEFKGTPIFRSSDILAFKVKTEIVNEAYLISELNADYVKEQLVNLGSGASVMPFIRMDDLLEIVVKLPSLEEQKAKVRGIYELSDKIRTLQEKRNALAHGKSLRQFNEFASLKHTLGRPRQNILDWSDNLLDFLNSKHEGFEEMNKAFEAFYEIDIIAALKEIKADVNFMTDVLEKGENGLVLNEYEKQILALSEINAIINDLSNNGFNFKIKKLPLKSELLKERGILANKILFKTLLDNILTNANKYAFEKKDAHNEVVIELTEVDDLLLVEIKNNGKPFPKNFDREKFIAKYSTANSSTGTGLGVYDINRIAVDFNNPDCVLSLNEDPIYPVIFKFQFPIQSN